MDIINNRLAPDPGFPEENERPDIESLPGFSWGDVLSWYLDRHPEMENVALTDELKAAILEMYGEWFFDREKRA